LKITDLRYARLKGVPHGPTVIRLETNQGLVGWGELRDGASPTYALFLKSRLLGENPCQVDRLFRKIKQFGGHGRFGGGVSGIEMALWDLAGKAYGVPVYQLLGGKFRDTVRVYADTRQSPPPEPGQPLTGQAQGQLLKARAEAGITWLKCDVGIGLLRHIPGTLSQPYPQGTGPDSLLPHPFTGIELTSKGVELLTGYLTEVREVLGMEIPLAVDHLGHLSVNSLIRLARAWEPLSLAWIEDPLPWQYPRQLQEITNSVAIPILTGEDIYLKEEFARLAADHVVDMFHPDLATAGGLLETKKIGDLAGEQGIPMAIHCSGTPIHFMASVHCAAATENFLCLEHHALDLPWWPELVLGAVGPLLQNGFVAVPDRPGLGVELNLEAAREHLDGDQFFDPTSEWDLERAWDRTWS
jgi:L-alanine-DL-glutamate epimerase-like enolase superfamily enzyme